MATGSQDHGSRYGPLQGDRKRNDERTRGEDKGREEEEEEEEGEEDQEDQEGQQEEHKEAETRKSSGEFRWPDLEAWLTTTTLVGLLGSLCMFLLRFGILWDYLTGAGGVREWGFGPGSLFFLVLCDFLALLSAFFGVLVLGLQLASMSLGATMAWFALLSQPGQGLNAACSVLVLASPFLGAQVLALRGCRILERESTRAVVMRILLCCTAGAVLGYLTTVRPRATGPIRAGRSMTEAQAMSEL